MKRILPLIFLTVSACSYAQKSKLSEVIVDLKRSYEIPNEGKVYNTLFDLPEGNDTVNASLIVNGDTLRDIRSAKANLKGDTLRILVYQTDPAYHHQFVISVIKDKYYITYKFLTSGEQVKREIKPLETKLILNSLDFSKGKEIRGYTEYKGKCLKGCWEDLILVKGNFKVVIE
jgi:hypothetical protein